MALEFSDKYLKSTITKEDLDGIAGEVNAAVKTLEGRNGAGSDFLGWVDLPVNYDREEVARVVAAAEKIKKTSDVLIVIGIGGSYLGARAAIEFVKGNYYNEKKKDTPNIYFVGNDISSSHLSDVLELCEGRDVCVNVISKSGTTTEPAIAFRVFREFLYKKYGDAAKERIFVTTDKARGALRKEADACGYETFVIPDDVGGRYSVLTPVGLLPIAVAGIDIVKMLEGAAKAREELSAGDVHTNACYKYAAIRNILNRRGKKIELLAVNDPALTMTCEWWKQLFGESEGKDLVGLYPSSVVYTTDLHSMGQFIQDGARIMFETVVNVGEPKATITIGKEPVDLDGLNYLAGKDMDFVNKSAMNGTILAHTDGNVPNLMIKIPKMDEFHLGQLFYFFEFACGVSGYILGVNPFNQPGVESYKKNMFALLGKPGYEEEREALLKRL